MDFEEFSITIRDTQRAGDLGYAWGVYSYRQTPKAGGDTTPFEGKFMTLYRRTDAGWKIYRDAFNANTPPQG
jgi:ketosteroid isomerase-like protein